MEFLWDKEKAASNKKRHKVAFEEAITVFRDPMAFIFYDEDHSIEERREIIIGRSVFNRLLLVFFTERPGNILRIFSARPATKKERLNYEENISR